MKAHVIVISIIIGILFIIAINNPNSVEQLPWSSSLTLKKNLTPYLVVLIVTFACYSFIFTLINTADLRDKSKHTEITSGKIINIEYSSIRVNNTPRFKITAEYNDIEGTFDYLDEAVQFNFDIGDEVIIKYNPNNAQDAHIDIEASIKNKTQPKHSKIKLKIIEVNPKIDQKENLYEVIGQIYTPESGPKKSKFLQELTDKQVQKLVPGSIHPCLDTGSDIQISIT